MAGSGGGRRKYHSYETSLDVLKDIVSERVSRDDFAEENDEVRCRVLKVFKPPRNTKIKGWIDHHLPYRGRPPAIVAFYGRVIGSGGRIHIHSLYPDPTEYTMGDWRGIDRTKRAYTEELVSQQKARMLEMYPLFLGIISSETPIPSVGDEVMVRFPVRYPDAGGERVGLYMSKAPAQGPNVETNVDVAGGHTPFTPEARAAKPAPVTPPPPANIPTNIIMVGDEMFGSNATKTVRTGFVNIITGKIKGFYRAMAKASKSGGMSDDKAKSIAKTYGLSDPKIVKKASQKFFAIHLMKQESSAAARKKIDELGDDPSEEAVQKIWAEEKEANSGLSNKANMLRNPKFHVRAWAWADVSFFSKDGEEIHAGNAGQPQVVLTTQEKADLVSKHGKKWHKHVDTVPSAHGVLKRDISNFNKLTPSEQPDFFIVAGPVGRSALPGWHSPLPGAPAWDWLWDAGVTGAGAGKKINYGMMDEYCRMMAEEQKTEFIKYYKEQFGQLLELMFMYKNLKGGVILGPPVIAGKGNMLQKAQHDTAKADQYVEISEIESESIFGEPQYFMKVKSSKKLKKKEKLLLVWSAIHDPNYWVRKNISQAMQDAAKEWGKEKVYDVLPYESRDFLDSGLPPVQLNKQSYKALWGHSRARHAYASKILDAICHYIAGVPPSTALKQRGGDYEWGWDTGSFGGKGEAGDFAKIERDIRVMALLRKRIVELRDFYGEESLDSIKQIKKQMKEIAMSHISTDIKTGESNLRDVHMVGDLEMK